MTHRVYSGPRGSAAISPLDKDRMLFKEFDTLDAALAWARHLTASGRVPLRIEGDDGNPARQAGDRGRPCARRTRNRACGVGKG
jgi:hypothetical protein